MPNNNFQDLIDFAEKHIEGSNPNLYFKYEEEEGLFKITKVVESVQNTYSHFVCQFIKTEHPIEYMSLPLWNGCVEGNILLTDENSAQEFKKYENFISKASSSLVNICASYEKVWEGTYPIYEVLSRISQGEPQSDESLFYLVWAYFEIACENDDDLLPLWNRLIMRAFVKDMAISQ